MKDAFDNLSTKNSIKDVHKKTIKKIFEKLNTAENGLSSCEAHERLNKYGKNILSEKKDKPLIIKFLLQFHNFFSYLLLIGAFLSFLSEYLMPGQGSIYVGFALLGVTILNAIFTFIQDYKAEKTMNSFKKLMNSHVEVLRDGTKHEIDSEDLVIGDIIYLNEGDKITADARIIELNDLKVDHSSLTGESEPQLRSLNATSDNVLLSRNMVFSGTLVQSGHAKAVVVATGDNTQIGEIAKTTNLVSAQISHLQLQISYFIKIISFIAIFLGISFFFLGLILTENTLWISLIFAIGIIVANVPEGLLPTVTLTLSIAAKKMAKQNVFVRNIDAIETFGSLTVICSDKTGTLTENNLFVHGIYLNNNFYDYDRINNSIKRKQKNVSINNIKGFYNLTNIMLLCNNSYYDNIKKKYFGDSTEICLKKFVSSFQNSNYFEKIHKRNGEIPFSSETKYMITSNIFEDNNVASLKGAPEIVLNKCENIFIDGKIKKLTIKLKKDLIKKNNEFSKKGFRVLGLAMKQIKSHKKIEKEDKNNFCFYGLVIMQDPPRKEVPLAVAQCHEAGVKIIVVSGDQGTTVENIARQVGIVKTNNTIVVTGEDMQKYSDDKLKELLKNDEIIFARTLPKDKLRVVTLLKEMGEIVAVTGDGVNDAPALKKADIGIAMGVSGTEVAKEASDIVLMDDNFASIAKGMKEGRTVYDNIKNFITYILTSNTPQIVPFLVFIILGWPLALPVLLILAIDLGTDMLPAIGLGVEKSSKDIMKRKPRNPKSKLLNWKMIARSYGFIGPLMTLFSYIIFFKILFAGGWQFGQDISVTDPLYMSAIMGFFATVVICQMFNVFACRTSRESVFTKGFFSNKVIVIGLITEVILVLLIALNPFFQKVFATLPFDLVYIPLVIMFGLILLFAEEIRKYFYRKYNIFGVDDDF
ncbi:MAG: cation-translocating P-type ATPase [Nanoarchaeota archaeon]